MKLITDIKNFLMNNQFQWAFTFTLIFTLLLVFNIINMEVYKWIIIAIAGGDAYRRGKK